MALWATWKVGRWVVLLLLDLRAVDEAWSWAGDHWALLAVGLAAVFAVTLVLTRAVLPRLTR